MKNSKKLQAIGGISRTTYGDGTYTSDSLTLESLQKLYEETKDQMTTGIMYFQHVYRTAGFSPDAKKTHACLLSGFWCWENALTNPLMAYHFLIWKIKTKLALNKQS